MPIALLPGMRLRTRSLLLLSAVLSLAACGDDTTPPDDGGRPDGGADARVVAADARVDSASPDAMMLPACAAAPDVAAFPMTAGLADLTWTDGRFAVVVPGDATAPARLATMDESGRLTSGDALTGAGTARIAWSGRQLAAFYRVGEHLNLVRTDRDGRIVAGSELVVPHARGSATMVRDLTIAWSPVAQEWGLAWSEDVTPFAPIFARVSAAGALVGAPKVLAPGGLLWSTASAPLVWAGDRWALAWDGFGSNKHLVELDVAGEVIPGSLTTITTLTGERTTMAADGTGYELVSAGEQGGFQARAARVRKGGGLVAGSEALLGGANDWAVRAGILWDGQSYLATWDAASPTAGLRWDIESVRIDANGAVISGSRRAITCSRGFGDLALPRWNGVHHAVHDSFAPRLLVF